MVRRLTAGKSGCGLLIYSGRILFFITDPHFPVTFAIGMLIGLFDFTLSGVSYCIQVWKAARCAFCWSSPESIPARDNQQASERSAGLEEKANLEPHAANGIGTCKVN